MDQILKKSEVEFDKYIQGITDDATISISKLLKKEIDLEKAEVEKMSQQLSLAKQKHNALLQERYEQKMRESDLQIEFLNRRLTRIENKMKNSKSHQIASNSPAQNKKPSTSPQSPQKHLQNGTHPTNDQPKNEHQLPINAKSLINKFEQKHPATPPNKQSSLQKKHPETTKSILVNSNNQSNYTDKSNNHKTQNAPIMRQKIKGQTHKSNRRVSFDDRIVSFADVDDNHNHNHRTNNDNNYHHLHSNNQNNQHNHAIYSVDSGIQSNPYNIKLKKVGLPADGKQADQELYTPNGNLKIEEKHQSSPRLSSPLPQHKPHSNGSINSPKTPGIDIKQKHTNYNAIIRENIQREMNELTLKPVQKPNENNQINIPKESLTKGKFDFSGERGLTATNGNRDNSSSNQLTASKSMPFLSSPSIFSGNLTTTNQNNKNNSDQQNVDFDQVDGPNKNNSDVLVLKPIKSNETDESGECARELIRWDSRPLLKELYQIQKRSIQQDTTLKQFKDYIDIYYYIFRGIKYSDKYVRVYITIINGEMSIYENSVSRTSIDKFEMDELNYRRLSNNELEILDNKSDIFKVKINQSNKITEFLNFFNNQSNGNSNDQKFQITPLLYDESPMNENRKILIIDIGSCSVRAGVLKKQPTLPSLYFPNVAAIEKDSGDAIAVGIDACNPEFQDTCFITRLLKPDTTLEHTAFTSGGVELLFKLICERLKIDATKYCVMLSVPHNVSQPIRSKLVNVLFYRLNFLGVSICGQSLLALHSYCEPTGILVDIGYRTEVLPVTHGIVQFGGVHRSLLGGHLGQIAMSHLLPLDVHSITDFFIIRHIMEQSCQIAENYENAYNSQPSFEINLDHMKLPQTIQKKLQLQHKDRCLPVEGFFNPDIYSLDIKSLPDLIRLSINACPVDCRRKLTQNICLSGAASQFPGFTERLEKELKNLLPATAKVRIVASPDRAHYSYLGACFVAINGHFEETIVTRKLWEESESTALKKWHQ